MIRRQWVRGVVASVVTMGIGLGVVGVTHDRLDRRGMWHGVSWRGEFWRKVGAAVGEEQEARFLHEPRAVGFADAQERWMRGPLQAAVARALPGVVLEHAECRETMCRWSYLVPDEYSGNALLFAPWDERARSSLTYGDVRRVSVLAPTPVTGDGAIVAWFEALTADVMRARFAALGRFDPDTLEMIERWERAHGR